MSLISLFSYHVVCTYFSLCQHQETKEAVVFVLIASESAARSWSVESVDSSRPAVQISRHVELPCSRARGFGSTGTNGSELCLFL